MSTAPFKIAIIGFGPKGLYGFERLLAHIKAYPTIGQVEIHLFNKTRFMGSGDVYRSDQPGYLLMNFSNKYIDMWSREAPLPIVKHPLRFSEYLASKQQTSLEEIDSMYAPRATVGAYLEMGFARLCENLPENVTLYQHIVEVNAIEKRGKRYSIAYTHQRAFKQLHGFKQILITTGHQRYKIPFKSNENQIPFIYPVDEQLKGISEKEIIAVKGMGLTCIDGLLALTEGRGGVFKLRDNAKYTYTPSGLEPKQIFPFSKSGWPMMPKIHFNTSDKPELFVKSVKRLPHRQLNFRKEILPLLKQDMEFAYYSILFSNEGKRLVHAPNYEEIKSQILTFHNNHKDYPQFSLENILQPLFDPTRGIHQNVMEYLIAFTTGEGRDILHTAQLCAAAVWRRVSPVFNEIYSFSGLDARSHKEFDNYYFGKLNRIAFGPPAENLKKIISLAELGIVDFRYAKNPQIEKPGPGFVLSNSSTTHYCDVLIDARIPKNNLKKEASGLFQNLCDNKLARPYVNRNKHFAYAPGIVEINRNGNLINPLEKPENITLYGTPTEGIVHDNDTLLRTRNNFAGPWAQNVIKHLILQNHEANNRTSNTFTRIE